MRDTEHASAEGGLQERQLVAGRYRLTARHREDETTEVWRAFDEPGHHVVMLAFLRDRRPASRDRFVTEARGIAMQPATVMRVAGIHDDADGTFIVYEDLVPQSEPRVVEPEGFAPGTPSPELSDDSLIGHGLTGLKTVISLHDPALIDRRLLVESASEVAAAVRSRLADANLDEARLNTVVADAHALLDRAVVEARARLEGARALLEGVDLSGRGSAFERGIVAAQRLTNIRLRVQVPTLPTLSMPHLSLPTPRVRRPPHVATASVETVIRPPRAPRAPRFRDRPVIRVRWGRVLFRGLSLGLIATVAATFPPDLAANLAANLKSEFDSRLDQVLQPAPSAAPELTRASFELPPLSAYGAAFESQGAYPTARPNGPVEWVVALRNTGSAGWYKGIDGAQASLALSDGTNAAVQSTLYVGPGQVGWFVIHVRASAEVGAYKLPLRLRIDGRGPLPDLGIFATVTVSRGP